MWSLIGYWSEVGILLCAIVGKVENSRGVFAAGDQTEEFLENLT